MAVCIWASSPFPPQTSIKPGKPRGKSQERMSRSPGLVMHCVYLSLSSFLMFHLLPFVLSSADMCCWGRVVAHVVRCRVWVWRLVLPDCPLVLTVSSHSSLDPPLYSLGDLDASVFQLVSRDCDMVTGYLENDLRIVPVLCCQQCIPLLVQYLGGVAVVPIISSFPPLFLARTHSSSAKFQHLSELEIKLSSSAKLNLLVLVN